MNTVFFRLLPYDDKGASLLDAVADLHQGHSDKAVHIVESVSFRQIIGSPFAYWVSENVRQLFTTLPPFEGDDRTIRVGLQTSDDFRFLRLWWEVAPAKLVTGKVNTTPEEFRQQTFVGKCWVPLAKGGAYSPYYADLHLVVNWERDGTEMKLWAGTLYNESHWSRIIKNVDYYFRAGLTWPQRTQKGINSKPLPRGAIHSNKGSSAFIQDFDTTFYTVGLMNSKVFRGLANLLTCFGSYNEGVIKRVVIPETNSLILIQTTLSCINLIRILDTTIETSHIFIRPALLQAEGETLTERGELWQVRLNDTASQLDEYQREIDDIAFQLYGIEGSDRHDIEESLKKGQSVESEEESTEADEGEEETLTADAPSLLIALLSWAVGCAFGRWDARLATGQREIPELPDPFAPLPACSPGMLTGADGLPVTQPPVDYPLTIDQDGILVDDPKHSDDIVKRVRDVIELLWGEQADAIEQEACTMLGVKSLRDYFRNPSKGGFWLDHIARYSKSRRKAPIYWLLQSSKRNYGLWLYYHKLDKNILFNALMQYAEPKLRQEQSELEQLKAEVAFSGSE